MKFTAVTTEVKICHSIFEVLNKINFHENGKMFVLTMEVAQIVNRVLQVLCQTNQFLLHRDVVSQQRKTTTQATAKSTCGSTKSNAVEETLPG